MTDYIDDYESLLNLRTTVLNFATYGSFQGSWLARIDHDGVKYITGSYGSCSVCDELQATGSLEFVNLAEQYIAKAVPLEQLDLEFEYDADAMREDIEKWEQAKPTPNAD